MAWSRPILRRVLVALHLGCGPRATGRRWPVQRFVQLAERLRAAELADKIVLTGTPDEQPLIAEFMGTFSGHVVDATGLGSIERTAEVLRRCQLAVSNDTGIMHLAAAMGTPTVGLFGPNTPQRSAPVGPRALAVYTTHVPCSPCIQVHQGIVPDCTHRETGRAACWTSTPTQSWRPRHACWGCRDAHPESETFPILAVMRRVSRRQSGDVCLH